MLNVIFIIVFLTFFLNRLFSPHRHSTHAMINRPPSPMNPPPALNKYEMDDDASSDVESSFSDEGQHDVDIDVNPYTTIVDPAKSTTGGGGEDIPLKQGITSRASLNFQVTVVTLFFLQFLNSFLFCCFQYFYERATDMWSGPDFFRVFSLLNHMCYAALKEVRVGSLFLL